MNRKRKFNDDVKGIFKNDKKSCLIEMKPMEKLIDNERESIKLKQGLEQIKNKIKLYNQDNKENISINKRNLNNNFKSNDKNYLYKINNELKVLKNSGFGFFFKNLRKEIIDIFNSQKELIPYQNLLHPSQILELLNYKEKSPIRCIPKELNEIRHIDKLSSYNNRFYSTENNYNNENSNSKNLINNNLNYNNNYDEIDKTKTKYNFNQENESEFNNYHSNIDDSNKFVEKENIENLVIGNRSLKLQKQKNINELHKEKIQNPMYYNHNYNQFLDNNYNIKKGISVKNSSYNEKINLNNENNYSNYFIKDKIFLKERFNIKNSEFFNNSDFVDKYFEDIEQESNKINDFPQNQNDYNFLNNSGFNLTNNFLNLPNELNNEIEINNYVLGNEKIDKNRNLINNLYNKQLINKNLNKHKFHLENFDKNNHKNTINPFLNNKIDESNFKDNNYYCISDTNKFQNENSSNINKLFLDNYKNLKNLNKNYDIKNTNQLRDIIQPYIKPKYNKEKIEKSINVSFENSFADYTNKTNMININKKNDGNNIKNINVYNEDKKDIHLYMNDENSFSRTTENTFLPFGINSEDKLNEDYFDNNFKDNKNYYDNYNQNLEEKTDINRRNQRIPLKDIKSNYYK